ncbi:hypothetical protein ACJZ2D_002064 [Fusarium nematophilum]
MESHRSEAKPLELSQPKNGETPQLEETSAEPPSQLVVNGKLPYREASASWPLPEVQLLVSTFSKPFPDLPQRDGSQVGVARISGGRQEQVFARIGVKYDWNYPFHFWFFIGKMMSKALFQDDSLLDVLNYIPVNNYEFVGYVNKARGVDDQGSKDQVNVVDVHLKRPQPGQPIQIFWKPARGLVVQKIEEWVKEKMPPPR